MLALAFRNLFRNRRRTLLTMCAIAVGLTVILFTVNMQSGTYVEMVDSATRSSTGHIVVERQSYVSDPDPMAYVADSDRIAAALTAALPDAVVTQRMTVDGLLTAAGGAVGAQVRGLQPSLETDIDLVPSRIVEGEWLEDGDERGIVLGALLAESLDASIGDRIVFQANYGGEDISELLRVRGVFRTGAADIDGFSAVTTLETARRLVGHDGANQVTVHLSDPHDTDRDLVVARGAVGTLADGVAVLSWRDALPSLVDGIQVDRVSGDVMLVFLGLIVAFGIVNTVLMSVMERVREFGVLMALGVRPRRIAALVVLEAFLLGLASATVGLALGLAVSWPFIVWGLDFAALTGGPMTSAGALLDGRIHFVVDPARVAFYVVGTVFVTVLASLYPAFTVLRMRPVEAMRSV